MPPRLPLCQLPTPLHLLPGLTRFGEGPRLWIKRDDLTGFGGGGNKARKLEYLLADALEKEASAVITSGGPQSNHCRQTAAGAAKLGLSCHLVLGGPETSPTGNVLLDRLCGARLHWCERSERDQRVREIAEICLAEGERPCVVPVGGSSGLGALGYVAAFEELANQAAERSLSFDTVVVASSSGGTQAGLALGARLAGFEGRILGVSIDQPTAREPSFEGELAAIANAAAALLGVEERLKAEDFEIAYDFLGGGYGVVGPLERDAIRTLARTDGVFLDPVYTGRALGGLMALIRDGTVARGETVLFWHTGGAPALSAFSAELLGDPA